ncbi:MAG: hypothetical protein H6626_06500 [Pseudobdellovibrionaceae bacterium]|nr:hypothetical protein [Bdellovibrionales bacterium]USN48736.1 MAG: hypothetical protein H6626_06500 [Pseudobdellovibrionaceae bacterium]
MSFSSPEGPQFFKLIKPVYDYLLLFFRHPFNSVREIPDWNWPTVLLLHTSVVAICGTVSGLIAQSLRATLEGLILLPISSTVALLILSAVFYYLFLFVHHIELSLRRLFAVMVVASLPYFALYTLQYLIPVVHPIGFAITGLLIHVGLVSQFDAPKKFTARTIAGIFALLMIMWLGFAIQWAHDAYKERYLHSPKTLEELEKSLNQ